jgi:hypothetical protein
MMNNKKYILSLLFFLSFLFGDTDADVAVTGSGTIPFCASWTSSTTVPDYSTVDIDAYDADFLEFASIISVTDFDANYAFNITATKGTWTLPSAYDVTNGAKKANGSDSDFLIKVDDITVGTTPSSSNGLAVANSHNTYQAATTGGTVIASGGSTVSGSAHGVESAAFNIDGKVLLDWDTDIPGSYALSITITVASQ